MPAPLFYHLALLQVPLIGPVQAKILLQHFAAEDIFKAKKSLIEKIDGIGAARAQHIKQFSNFQRIEEVGEGGGRQRGRGIRRASTRLRCCLRGRFDFCSDTFG